MTDDKGAGEGPYKILDRICFGVDEKHGRMEYVIDTEEKLTIANLSYAEGRKSAEKELRKRSPRNDRRQERHF